MQVTFMGHTWPNLRTFLGELFAAAFILGIPFWGSWAYYIVTGNYLDFGGQ